ncbi:sec7 domain-containing protein [Ditylenchus destructor]|nr:sec7 domain-containing protein [Ditylenchus destructor]
MNDVNPDLIEMFLKNSIERILADPAVKRKDPELKKACELALEQLNAEIDRKSKQNHAPSSKQDILPETQDFILADNYFRPFELACQSKNTKIVALALDSIQKLINHRHLVGDCPDPIPENPQRLLVDRIVQAICYPFQGPHTDEAIQLQIITTILTVILADNCPCHESSMLLAVRTCFNIHLASRNPTNQMTAKGVLTQTIHYVITEMVRKENIVYADVDGIDLDEAAVKGVMDSIVNQIAASEDASSTQSFGDNKSISNMPNGDIRSSRRSSTGGAGSVSLSGGGMMNGSGSNLNGYVAGDATPGQQYDDPNTLRIEFKTVEEKDAFLIFRALCKLSMKELPKDPDPTSHELRSKLLSLDMILLIMQNVDATSLPEKHSFIMALKNTKENNLCVALTHNAVSPIISVFEKALAIFVHLVNKFKGHLKKQIEVFFKEIIISILDSSSSSFDHKWDVLNTIAKICNNSQNLVDIYVNYDCHLNSANIFEALVTHLNKIASGYALATLSSASTLEQKKQESKMRELGLDCLIQVLQCLVEWYEELHIGKTGELSTSGNATDTEDGPLNGLDSAVVNKLMHAKHQKEIIENGIDLFARKPKQGLAFLQQKGFVGTAPAEIARFFYEEERIDKTVVGDFLGDGNDFNKEVMYAYVDMFDFTGTTIVQALRAILDKFRLPGEAQKIDRIMEKFASRYCDCNPGLNLFASADTAYVLSYSIIMLTTDLHNAQVKRKMTKEEYIKMNRGINDQADLPDEFLCQIYDDISANEIKTKPGNIKRPKLNATAATWRQKKLFQNLELESIAQTAHALMEAATYSAGEFTSASHFEHARQMFTMVWTPCLAAFSIGMKSSDEKSIWQRCLQGIRCGIRVACVFRMTMQREAYIQALNGFTLLTDKSSLSEMKAKNVASIKMLITIGDEDGNFLDKCWYDILKCISQLELVQLIGSGTHIQAENVKNAFKIEDRSLPNVQECLGETSSQSVVVAVDRIFQGSSKLSGEAIVHFVRELCQVSLEELRSAPQPRMFMLQKIVEISSYNMNRIRIEWSMIWNVLGEHFNLAGCSTDETISHFALDALRQLSTKFLEKGELPNFRFQKEFLRPFEVIMEKNKSLECREMIVACVTHMVKSHADKIRSGWKNVFSVFTRAASENRPNIAETAFKTTAGIMTNVFPRHFIELMDSFQEMIQCLSEFACNLSLPDEKKNLEAIQLIRDAADLVSQNTRIINSHQSEDDHNLSETQRVWLKGWFPIIFGLSRIISRSNLNMRTRSLSVMFEIIKTFGKEFSNEWWKDLFKLIFRIFDFVKLSDMGENEKNEWMMTTCNHALCSIVDVFTDYYTVLAPILLSDIYQQMFWCIQMGSEELAKAAINNLEDLIISNGEKFTDEIWSETVELLLKIFHISKLDFDAVAAEPTTQEPKQSNQNSAKQSGEKPSSDNQDAILSSYITKCIIQLEIVDAVSNILFGRNAFKVEGPKALNSNQSADSEFPCMFNYVTEEHLMSLVKCLKESHVMSRQRNNYAAQRAIMWKNKAEEYRTQLSDNVRHALDYYLASHSDTLKTSWLPVIQMLLNRTSGLSPKRFSQLGRDYRLLLARLIESDEQPIIRVALHRVIQTTINEQEKHANNGI